MIGLDLFDILFIIAVAGCIKAVGLWVLVYLFWKHRREKWQSYRRSAARD